MGAMTEALLEEKDRDEFEAAKRCCNCKNYPCALDPLTCEFDFEKFEG